MRAAKRGVESSLISALPDTSTVLVEAQGFPLMVHIDNSYMAQSLIMAGIHEREETEFFKSIASMTNTFIDVGANIGYFTVLMSRLMPEGTVLAIEPDPVNLETLRRNVSLNRLQNTLIVPFALSNRPHTVTLFRDQTNLADVRMFPDTDLIVSADGIEAVSFDDYCQQNSLVLRVPAVVKIDVQGAELEVLQSMEGFFNKNQEVTLLVEVSPSVLEPAGTSASEIEQQLTDMRFQISLLRVDGSTSEPLPPGGLVAAIKERGRGFNIVAAKRSQPTD
jgi:FkbM family methyltransferase